MRASIKIILDETFTSNFLMSTHGNYLWPLFAHSGIYSNSYKLLQFTILDRTARLSFTKTIRYFPSVHKHSRAKYFPSYLNISLQTLLSKHIFFVNITEHVIIFSSESSWNDFWYLSAKGFREKVKINELRSAGLFMSKERIKSFPWRINTTIFRLFVDFKNAITLFFPLPC